MYIHVQSTVDLTGHFITIQFCTTQLVHSTHQMKLPNVSLHHQNKYTCDHWKYEHFFKTKESWKSQGAFVWDQSGIRIIGIMQVSVCLGAILIPEYLDSILAILLLGAEQPKYIPEYILIPEYSQTNAPLNKLCCNQVCPG